MRRYTFSVRTAKEILRDPLNLFFGLGFPLALIGLLTTIQQNVPVEMFALNRLTPGVTVFGLSFMTLFSAVLLARDRETALLQRLYTTPLTAADFILGYAAPMLPIAFAQSLISYGGAALLGLRPGWGMLLGSLALLPSAVFFIALGLICGSVLNVKQAGGVCGALLTNLSAWLSGIWFDIELVGGAFKSVAEALPFLHAVELARDVFAGRYQEALPHLAWVLGYAALAVAGAVLLFLRQMKRQ